MNKKEKIYESLDNMSTEEMHKELREINESIRLSLREKGISPEEVTKSFNEFIKLSNKK